MTAEINALANDALDIAFAEDAGKTLRTVTAAGTYPRGKMQVRLKALDKEAEDLEEQESKFTSNNEVLVGAMDAYEDHLLDAQALTIAAAPNVEQSAVHLAEPTVVAKLFPKRTEELLDKGINPLQLDTLDEYSGVADDFTPDEFEDFYTGTMAWDVRMEQWAAGYAALSTDTIYKGIAQGWGPQRTAKTLRNHAENIPAKAMQNLLFTLLFTLYQSAQLALEQANGSLLRGKIRIAVLDNKTCLACIALHGTPLAVGQRVDDHYRGRCTSFYQIPGGPDFPSKMQADSEPGLRNFVTYQDGISWFDGLSAERQAQQASFMRYPGKLRLFQEGNSLTNFVGNHYDDIFGPQIIEESIKRSGLVSP